MRILGIDPGLATMGWGVIEADGYREKLVQYGALITYPRDTFPTRLRCIYTGVRGLLETFKPDGKFSTWLFTIARNTAFDHKNKGKLMGKKVEQTPIDVTGDDAINVPADQLSPEDDIISTQDHENFLSCIDNLPEHYMVIAKMCFVDNLGYKEIAEKADIPVNTVKTRISRAKALIIQKMQDMEEEL